MLQADKDTLVSNVSAQADAARSALESINSAVRAIVVDSTSVSELQAQVATLMAANDQKAARIAQLETDKGQLQSKIDMARVALS